MLDLRVQPRASRNEFGELLGDRIKLRLTAPPVDGKANAALVRFLAGSFGVPKASVLLESGATGRNKRVRIRVPQHLPTAIRPPDG